MNKPTTAIVLIVVSLVSGSCAYRVPAREILPPPPWDSGEQDQSHVLVGRSANGLAFQRDAVESRPAPIKHPETESTVVYGSQRFPLRDAVEALPANVDLSNLQSQQIVDDEDQGERVPLRDAVEHREAPFRSNIDHQAIWIEPLSPPTLRGTPEIADPIVACHFDSDTVLRDEPFSLLPQGLPNFKCTHLVYMATTLDPQDLTIAARNPEYDEVKGGYKALTGFRRKDPALRLILSMSVHDSGLNSVSTRDLCVPNCDKTTESVLNYLLANGFDGIEIDWNVNSAERDIRSLKSLLTSLSPALSAKGLILAVSMGPNDPVEPGFLSIVDYVHLKAWRNSPGMRREMLALHPAPLKFAARLTSKWIEHAVPKLRRKIILGVPTFGQGYSLRQGNFTDAGAPVIGPGTPGTYTKRQDGRLAYFEVCEKLEEESWISGRDTEGPYLKRSDQWIGYEDPISVKIKMAYIRSIGLGGVSLWSLDLDDFQGICGDPWPMLNAAMEGLGIYDLAEEEMKKCSAEGVRPDSENCSKFYSCVDGVLHHGHCGFGRFFDREDGRCVTAAPEICEPGDTDTIVTWTSPARPTNKGEHLTLLKKDDGPRVVCYVTSWALYRKGDGRFVPENLDSRLCTDVVYAFAGLNPESLMVQSFDPWADIDNNLYSRVTSIEGVRVLLALGGWTDSSGDKYSRLVGNGASRRKFIAATVSFLKKHNFDGLSLEWNYPKCWQSDCRKGPVSDKPNFTKLVTELKKEFDQQNPRLVLAVAISGYKEVIDWAYEVGEISRATDFMSVMTYDYHGAWETKTGHLAPLYDTSGDSSPYYNANYTLAYLVQLGADKAKLLMGIPMYGQAYRLSDPKHADFGDPATGPGIPGEYTRQPGMLSYYEICDRIKRQGWKTKSGPIAYQNDQWVGYENPESVFLKGEYIRKHGYGGVTAWTVDLDDFLNRCCTEAFPLLTSVNRALGRISTKPPSTSNCQRPPEPITPLAPTMTTHSDAIEGGPKPTRPMTTPTTTKATTWPTWTEKPSTSTPSWTDSTTRWTPQTTKSTTVSITKPPATSVSWTTRPVTVTSTDKTTLSDQATTQGAPCMTGQYVKDPENCATYFRCVLGELKREQCAPGLHWDQSRGFCDWPSVVKCQPETETSTTYTTSRPISTTSWTTTRPTRRPTTTPKPAIVVNPSESPKKCEHGQYYNYPNSCTSFLICVNGDLISQQCGPGLNWNKEKNMCDWAFANPCTRKPQKNSLLVMKDRQTEACVPGSYTSVPGDCKSYKACLWGRHEVFKCAPGLHFNKNTRICDWPSRANCEEDDSDEADEAINEMSTSGVPASSSKPPARPTSSTAGTTTKRPTTMRPTTQAVQSTTLPSAVIDPAKPSVLSGDFKVVCYFTNWAWYRKGVGRYLPEHIDHSLCTHIVYGFAVLDYSELTIKAHDSWADFDNKFYERVVAYKKRGLKVLLALGGWNDSAGDKYSRLVNSPTSRKKFIDHALKFLEKYDFDGLDLDWEYPVCWQVNCKKGLASDKQAFAALLKELSAEFKPKGLLLTAAVSPSKKVIDAGYDVPALARYLDWIAVMTYDFHGQWDKKTGHVAPLYYHPEDDYDYFNANFSIHYWIQKGASPRDIVMGIPLYGQSFSINDPSAGTGLNSPASAGNAGEFTRAAGFLAYYEICDRIKRRGWKKVQDPEGRMGPYAYKGNQWVSFDDVAMVEKKARLIRSLGLGGGMVWALDLDDFRGRCDEGSHPLMHTLQRVLADPPNEQDRPIRPPLTELPSVVHTTSGSTVTMSAQTTPLIDRVQGDDGQYKVICYFTNWAWYRQEGGKFLPEDIDPDLCTHVLYGFAVLDSSSLTMKSHDSWADIDNKFYERVAAYKNKGIKVLLAIGGWNDSAGGKYSRLVSSASSRRKFIEQAIGFIEKYGFEGLDLDWEYPVCWQVDCTKGPASDKENFALFAKELSEAFKPKGLLLSAAVSPSKRVIDAGYDVPELAKYLDWISVMTYDYHGQWDKKTGHVAPLYRLPSDWEPTFNANFSINYWIEKGAPARKLVMGAPLYGQSFSLAERSLSGLNAPTYGGGEAGEATRARGFLSYYEICERTLKKGWTVVQDVERRIGPYAYKGDQWVSFDDSEQIRLKAELIKKLGLGGGMVWALDLDDFKNRCECEPSPLLRTMNRVLRNYPKGPLCPVSDMVTLIDFDESSTTEAITTSTQTSTTSRPTYLPPVTSAPTVQPTSSPEINDTVEIEAKPPPAITPIGDCGERLFVPHEEDCTKYFQCNFGILSEHSCPSGLYWNEDRCDWPENSRCKNGKHVTDVPQFFPIKQTEEPKKIICYLTAWSAERSGDGKFHTENIPELCTHILYGFATLDGEHLTINLDESSMTEVLGNVSQLKKKNDVKVLVSLGGWRESGSNKYSELAANPTSRKRFAYNVLQFIEDRDFDGLDIAWEYPVCWQADCNRGPHSDRESFKMLVKDLSNVLRSRDYLLSIAVSSSKTVIDAAYDVPTLVKNVDWINVMSYDYHGFWENKVGHVAPLYQQSKDDHTNLNVNYSINYWIESGAPPKKLVMGIPAYGQSFTLKKVYDDDPKHPQGFDAETAGPGLPGQFTRSAGFLAYYEICSYVKNDEWLVIKDSEERVGPFATKGNQWVGYDDVSSVMKKVELIKDEDLGGAMIWALDLDDFRGRCGCGKYPLLTALRHGLTLRHPRMTDCT